MRRKYRGFTLIEILIVVAIIGILATIVMLSLGGAQARSRYARVVSDMTSIAKAVDLYQIQHNNVYPADKDPNISPDEAGFLDYLPAWPKPPCSEPAYVYDYNNLSDGISVYYDYYTSSPLVIVPYYSHNIFNYSGVTTKIENFSQVTCKEHS